MNENAATDEKPLPRRPRIYPALLGLVALVLVGGGANLLMLGGSAYYLIVGSLLAIAAVMLWKGRCAGMSTFGAILLGTVAWSIWEVGFAWWALIPRVAFWVVLGAWMLLPSFHRRLARTGAKGSFLRDGSWRTAAVLFAAAVMLGALLHHFTPAPVDPRYQAGIGGFPTVAMASASGEDGEWQEWGRDRGGTRFSRLTQITPDNVDRLQVAWTSPVRIGAAATSGGSQATPIMVGDSLYTCNNAYDVFALDAETGRHRWKVRTTLTVGTTLKCRGVAYYRVPGASGLCAERIVAATGNARLLALDARTGKRCPGFGVEGAGVNLLNGLTKAPQGYYIVTSAPQIVRGKIVLGGWVMDGQYWGEPSGVIRAFDAVTGELAWAWDMGRPDRTGAPPPGETYTSATPNSWAPMSADEELGLVYLPTGNATPDFFGGNRRPFDDKYSSSVVALDAETGRPRWSFQTTHHDLWDYDVASQPVLADLPKPGGGIERALLVTTKRGEVFLLDRVTGKPLRKVEERPVPQTGAVPEERLSATQPFSVGMPSFRSADITESGLWGLTPLDQLYCRIKFHEARYAGTMTPPGLTPVIVSPGTVGGMNWGSASIDSDHGVMIVTTSKLAHYVRLITRAEADKRELRPAGANQPLHNVGGPQPQLNTPYGVDVSFFVSPLFVPCEAPPYGFISAVDLASGKLIWTRPIGSARGAGPFGIGLGLPIPLGTPLFGGGAITTRSGLAFVGATTDKTFRAFDVRSGRQLWQSYLPQDGFATPMTYVSPKSGRQFVVVASSDLMNTGKSDGPSLVAYALPAK